MSPRSEKIFGSLLAVLFLQSAIVVHQVFADQLSFSFGESFIFEHR
tara:strand:- start:446 stop:583 length:138 start_codon:yes stop_codon:yes gene_type:complete